MTEYECPDCGRDDFTSLRAAMLCPCSKFDPDKDKPVRGDGWLP